MNRPILLLILSILAGCATAQTTSSFNFSASTQSVSGWINVSGDPATAVRSATDAATGISISSIATANWHPSDACAADGYGASGGTFFPAAVMLNHWYQYGGSVSVYNASSPQLLISGLHTDSVYTLRMTGSSTTASNSNPTTYTVAGLSVAVPIANNSHNNVANGAVFTNISPDANGMIRVFVNTLTTTDVADICGIQIVSAGASSSSGTGSGNWKVSGTTVYDSVDNIAIGTSNPQGYKLAVNGTAIFTKVKVKPVGSWPDYVFHKDFRLPGLAELESYIREHSHLPGIASEQEVMARGIDVSEHEAALLRKVEELTLYLIEQNKRLAAQQKEIDALKALMSKKNH
jgi:hypothetical protein